MNSSSCSIRGFVICQDGHESLETILRMAIAAATPLGIKFYGTSAMDRTQTLARGIVVARSCFRPKPHCHVVEFHNGYCLGLVHISRHEPLSSVDDDGQLRADVFHV